jgi:hypothetical protein
MSDNPIEAEVDDQIIARILDRFRPKEGLPKVGMARATLVVDENVDFLGSPLQEANFHVVIPHKGMDDFDIKKELLAHRILVTKNTKDFLDDSPVLDYGIIGLEALPFVDPARDYKTNQTAKLISKAVVDFDLISERSGFVLMLKQNGRHVFKRLG